MDILDKSLPPLPSIPTEWAHDAVARAAQALEPITDPLLGHHSRKRRLASAIGRNRWALGASVLVLVGIVVMALRSTSRDDAGEHATEPHQMRSVA